MTYRIVEQDGIVEFDTIEELAAYKQWKARNVAPAQPEKVVVVKQPEQPKVAPAQIWTRPSHFLKDADKQRIREIATAEIARGIKRRKIAHRLGISESFLNVLLRGTAQPQAKRQPGAKNISEDERLAVKVFFDRFRGEPTKLDIERFAAQNKRKSLTSIVRVQHIIDKHRQEWSASGERYYSKVTNDELERFAKEYSALKRTSTGRVEQQGLIKLSEKLGIAVERAKWLLTVMTATPYMTQRTERQKFLFDRVKAMQKLDPKLDFSAAHNRAQQEWDRGKLGSVGEKPVEKKQRIMEVPEFPVVYPLSEDATRVFEQMMIDLIAKKHGQIDYNLASTNLQLREGREWDYRTYMEFLNQVIANRAPIARALIGCNAAKIRLVKGGGSMVIKYGG